MNKQCFRPLFLHYLGCITRGTTWSSEMNFIDKVVKCFHCSSVGPVNKRTGLQSTEQRVKQSILSWGKFNFFKIQLISLSPCWSDSAFSVQKKRGRKRCSFHYILSVSMQHCIWVHTVFSGKLIHRKCTHFASKTIADLGNPYHFSVKCEVCPYIWVILLPSCTSPFKSSEYIVIHEEKCHFHVNILNFPKLITFQLNEYHI